MLDGSDAFIDFLGEMAAEATTAHLGHNPRSPAPDPTRPPASGCSYDIFAMGETTMQRSGHVHDRDVKVDGTWLIEESVVTSLHANPSVATP